MTPLISSLQATELEAARATASAAGAQEQLIYIHSGENTGTTLAHDLQLIARFFEIVGLRVTESGLSVFGIARSEPASNPPESLEYVIRTSHEETLQKLREAERVLQRRSIQLLEADRRSTDSQSDREAYERKLRLAQLQTDKVKNTLSFRLGHALIHKTKSVQGLSELPKTLWNLKRDADDRRPRGGLATGLRKVAQSIARVRDKPAAFVRPSAPSRQVRSFVRRAPPFAIATGTDLRKLRVAGIFDEFTAQSFAPECELISLHAETWRTQLAEHPPHLLFVESAWQGAGGSWDRKVNQLAAELRDLVQWCRDANIPTAFWNKEDPVHFGTFLNTAALFDTVFTTDFDCIHRYRELLGHRRVYLLPFAAQPRMHNPIEKFERKNAACFAGAYYARYPERQRDFLRIVIKLLERGPVEIFDRNHGKLDPDYQFPASYRDYIVGHLPFSEIERAYKGYRYAININSIKTSQTMFARRVFELLASNTLTVSNYAKGIRVLFGDLVIASDDPDHLAARLDAASANPDPLRLIALRKVMAEHTYQDRLAYVVAQLFEGLAPRLTPMVAVVGAAADRIAVTAGFERQRYPHKRLVLVEDSARAIEELVGSADWVARFAADGTYGEHYLEDLAFATRYYDGPLIGVSSTPEGRYRTGQTVASAAAIVRRDQLGAQTFSELERAAFSDALAVATNLAEPPHLNTGLTLDAVLDHAVRVEVAPSDPGLRALGPADLAQLIDEGVLPGVIVQHTADGMSLASSLDIEGRQYVYQRGESPLANFGFDSKVRFHLDVTTGLRLQAVFIFLDQAKRRIGQTIKFAAMNHELELPPGAAYVQFGVLIVGPGTATVRRLVLGHVTTEEPTRIIGRSNTLLVTNGYPSTQALYRNGFVHRRVLDYRDAGVDVDVVCHRAGEPISYHEFEGTDVVTGRAEVLERALASNHYQTVLVHFLDEETWRELKPRLDQLRVFIWIHGAEIHPWHRRRYNYTAAEELESAKRISAGRVELWNDVLRSLHPNIHLITVSRAFAAEIEEDYGVALPTAQHTVIHNVIDTELFRYEPKPAAQRKRILSIRPFATRQYANDLSVAAILALAEKPWFGELDIHLIGDGPLFEDTVAPLRKLRNVLIERRFARQDEIAALHKSHGVFLCPTRWDSQGVSRDEAMASGLVPITTRIAAVPEFVDEESGFLAPPEDPAALAAAIETLYHDPKRFQRMSATAAARIRRERSPAQTTARELALFTRRS